MSDHTTPDSNARERQPRRPGGSDHEPQINMFNLDLDLNAPPSGESQPDTAGEDLLASFNERPPKAPRSGYSRRHLIMGVGILLLILVIIALAIGSKSGSSHSDQQSSANTRINLSDLAGNENLTDSSQPIAPAGSPVSSGEFPPQGQPIAPPAIASQPVQTAPIPNNAQDRLTVQGDLNNALNQPAADTPASLPTQAATLAPDAARPPASEPAITPAPAVPEHNAPAPAGSVHNAPAQPPAAVAPAHPAPHASDKPAPRPAQPNNNTPSARPAKAPAALKSSETPAITLKLLKTAPSAYFTVQLSSASGDNGLKSWIKKERLTNAVIYKTTRNGQPWYVLVSGIYPTRSAAQHAISTLPAAVQAKNPWIKPLRLVQQELKQ